MKKLVRKLIGLIYLSSLIACVPLKNLKKEEKVDLSLKKIIDTTYNGIGFSGDIYIKKFSGDIEYNGSSYSVTGRIISEEGKNLYITVYASLGIEVLRVEVERNNFLVINKLKKTAYRGSLKKLVNRSGFKKKDINIDRIQEILFASLKKGKVSFLKESENSVEFKLINNTDLIYSVLKNDAKISGIAYVDEKLKINVDYNYNNSFVERIDLIFTDGKSNIIANLIYDKVEFILPKNYKKVDLKDYTLVDY